MAIRCRHNETWPNTHEHQTLAESRACWMGTKVPVPAGPSSASTVPSAPQPVSAVTTTVVSRGTVTEKQLKYIEDLDGDVVHAYKLSWEEADRYIKDLLKSGKKKKVQTDPRLDMIKGMLDFIPDGYYATAPEGTGGHIDFVRISRVTKSTRKYPAGTLKIQTQHSDKWADALVLWPSGNWSQFKRAAIEMVMLVIADHKTCARRYGIEVQACQRCNKTLTDDRSRHYLIGPECEQKHGGDVVIEEVDDINDGLSFEQLVARGKPTRVWQESVI